MYPVPRSIVIPDYGATAIDEDLNSVCTLVDLNRLEGTGHAASDKLVTLSNQMKSVVLADVTSCWMPIAAPVRRVIAVNGTHRILQENSVAHRLGCIEDASGRVIPRPCIEEYDRQALATVLGTKGKTEQKVGRMRLREP